MSAELHHGFGIEVSKSADRVYRVALRGEIDLFVASELSEALASIPEADCDELGVDLSRLSFIDSTGIRALITAAQAKETSGGVMILTAPRPNVQRVFEIVRLSSIIPIETFDNAPV